jgi:hypothetical protein
MQLECILATEEERDERQKTGWEREVPRSSEATQHFQ